MSGPQFPKQSIRPLSPRALAATVRRFRHLCDIIERYRDPQTVREKQQLSRAINGLSYATRALADRHRRYVYQTQEPPTSEAP